MTLPAKDKLALVSNLGTMLGAGIPILEAVEALIEESKGGMRKVLFVLRDSLNEGHPLSHGLEKVPDIFDPVTINLIKAAEESGTLEKTLKDLEKSIKKQMAFNDKLKASLTYPAFVVVIFLVVISFILAFVIPRIAKTFSTIKGDLPAPTKFLLNASDLLLHYWMYILLGAVVLVIGAVWLFRAKRRVMVNMLLNAPGLRRLGQQIDLANFSRSMALLLSAGIPVAEALQFSEAVVVKKEMMLVIKRLKQDVNAGHPMSEGLRAHKGVIPQIMVRIIETAERSGTLEATMHELAEYFEMQVNRTLKTLATLLEPIMLVFMGLLVGGMMLAVIAPIYGLISDLNSS
ncbi:MAG TPA: type II secretion system F family protein [Candidatus Saccharimonadales bacterium]|nr:type II secretion system F family protein [Candidatus Saccharimonadales bacterium]